MEGVINFVPNVAIFFLMLELRIWYVEGAYVPPHDAPAIYRINQLL